MKRRGGIQEPAGSDWRPRLRAEIVRAAEQVLSTKSMQEISVDDVMSRTQFARTNFYRVFSDREELFLEVFARARTELRHKTIDVLRAGEGPIEHDLGQIIVDLVEPYGEHASIFRAFAQGVAIDSRIALIWREFIDEHIDALSRRIETEVRSGRSSIKDVKAVATAFILMVEGFVRRAYEDGDPTPEHISSTLLPIMLARIVDPD